MQAFLATVRENCPRSNWSRGVEWARVKGVVTADSETPESVTLKVKADSDLMTRTVTLYLDDEDWTCDCPGKDDVCAHVAAAAIALSALDVARARLTAAIAALLATAIFVATRGLFIWSAT